MRVYVIEEVLPTRESRVLAVFSTLEKAEEYAAHEQYYSIVVFEIDKLEGE